MTTIPNVLANGDASPELVALWSPEEKAHGAAALARRARKAGGSVSVQWLLDHQFITEEFGLLP